MIKHAQQTLWTLMAQRKTAAVNVSGLIRRLAGRARGAGQSAYGWARNNPLAAGATAGAAVGLPTAYSLGYGGGAGDGVAATAPVRQLPETETVMREPEQPGMVQRGLDWAGQNWQPIALGGGLGLGGLALANYLMGDEDEDERY